MKKVFIFLALALVAFTSNAQSTLEGDMNHDGILDVTDIMIIVTKILSGENTSVEPQSYLTCPDDHHPHLIDLGLPSGTKWACCNVGATKPEEFGGYYAWGETEEKSTYSWSTYIHCDGSEKTCHDLGNNIAGTQYDVAHVKWGGSWVMPTYDQIKELEDNCTYLWTTENGVKGGKFTSKNNGASIFLPAAGYRNDSNLYIAGSCGYYWSSAQSPSDSDIAYCLYFYSGRARTNYCDCGYGRSVRPVVRK
jgi:hypothetical protein